MINLSELKEKVKVFAINILLWSSEAKKERKKRREKKKKSVIHMYGLD